MEIGTTHCEMLPPTLTAQDMPDFDPHFDKDRDIAGDMAHWIDCANVILLALMLARAAPTEAAAARFGEDALERLKALPPQTLANRTLAVEVAAETGRIEIERARSVMWRMDEPAGVG